MNKLDDLIEVLHICDYAASYKGNFIRSLEFLGEESRVRNIYLFPYRVKRTGADGWIPDLVKGGGVVYVQKKSFLDNCVLMLKILRHHKIRYIFRHFEDIKIDFIIKALFKGSRVIRFMHCMYGNSEGGLRHKLRQIIWSGNTLVGVSSAVTDELLQAFPRNVVKTVENGVDFRRLKPQPMLQRNSDRKILLCMGYNIYVKGVDLALKVVREVQKRFAVELRIIVAGKTDPVLAIIESEFRTIPEWIKVLPPTDDIAMYMTEADVFLAPSRTEACPYSVLEAAYCQLPIVASKVGGQARLEVEGVYWFTSEDENGFLRQLELAIKESGIPEGKERRANVAQFITERYSLDKWRREVLDLIGIN